MMMIITTITTKMMKQFVFMYFMFHLTSGEEHSGEYCDTEVFKAECQGQDEVILMTSAKYGRMRVGRCVEYHLGYIDCYSDVITMMDRRCSGRKSCQVRVPDAEFESTGPCLKELKTYLEVNYRCIKAHSPQSESSCSPLVPINVTSSVGFISMTTQTPSSVVAPVTGTCSWWIVGRSGQTINLTLYDFNPSPQLSENSYRDQNKGSTSPCRQIGWLNDQTPMKRRQAQLQNPDGSTRDIPICAGDKRVTPVYFSKSHSLKLWLNLNPHMLVENYLLEFTVSGCPTPFNLPPKSWSKIRDDGALLVGCQGDPERREGGKKVSTNPSEGDKQARWILKCNTGTWTGYLGNCTDTRRDAGRLNSSEDVVISYGLAIAIGAVIGVLIATGIVLIVGLVREKRDSTHPNCSAQRPQELHETSDQPFLTSPPFKAGDYCHQFETSTSLNYERTSLRPGLDVIEDSSKIELQRTPMNREPQTRYVVRGGPLFCPHHRLHPMNSELTEDAPPQPLVQPKGYYSSSRSLPCQEDQWTEQGRSNSGHDELLQNVEPKLLGPIFTVVDVKQNNQHCLC